MRKTIIRKIACLLSFFIVAGSLGSRVYSASDTTEPQKDTSLISSKSITLRYFCSLPADAPKGLSSLSELDFYKELESETNIKISFFHTVVEEQLNRYMLMLASGDMPDLVELPWTEYPGILETSVEYGGVLKLDNLIEEYAPNLYELLNSDKSLKRQITSDDGSIYQIPGLNQAKNTTEYKPIIREDLLNKLGLKKPETIEQWEIVLKLIKENNLARTPLSFDITTLDRSNTFIGAYGVTKSLYNKGGRVVFGPIEKEYKELLTTLARWYKNGLLDKEFLVLKNTQIKNKVNRGDVAAFIGSASDMESASSALKTIDTGFELIQLQNPVLSENDKLPEMPGAKLANGIAVSKLNKYPIETVKWLNYAYNKSIKSSGKSQEQMNTQSLDTANLNSNQSVLMPQLTLTQNESQKLALIMKDINTYCLEMFAKFVVGAEPLDNFDEYVGNVRRLGIDRVLQIEQTALYRYNNRLSEDRIKVNFNGTLLKMDTNPIIVNGNPVLPVRFVMEALGYKVSWNEKEKTATVIKDDHNISLQPNSLEALVDGDKITLNTEVFILNDRTYVPMELLTKTPGIELKWDEQERSVNILDGKLSLKSYFPQENKVFKYNGGFEGGGYTRETVMTDEEKIQIYETSTAANVVKVYTVNEEEAALVIFEEEYNRDKSYLNEGNNINEVILRSPVKIGTSWTNQSDKISAITGVNIDVSTPAGVFSTIEITTKVDNAVIKEYYAPKIGLVKSEYKADNFEMLSELIKIEDINSK